MSTEHAKRAQAPGSCDNGLHLFVVTVRKIGGRKTFTGYNYGADVAEMTATANRLWAEQGYRVVSVVPA
jgi:hypothetical protein